VAADRRLHELERLFRETGNPSGEEQARSSRAVIALERGDLELADRLLRSCDLTRASFLDRLNDRGNRSIWWLLRGQAAAAREVLSSIEVERGAQHRFWIYVNGYFAVALALEGRFVEAEQRLADVGPSFDRNLVGIERFLALCRATVDWARIRDTDPEGAARTAKAALAAGTLVPNDEGFPIERPGDVNLLRQLLLRLAVPDGAGFDTRAWRL
jgi:hypothetical protein